MKSFLVIGLGQFGRHLATRLTELGNEVMVVDRDEERVAALASVVTAASVGDCQDEKEAAASATNTDSGRVETGLQALLSVSSLHENKEDCKDEEA